MLTRLNCAPKDYLRVCFSLCIHLAYWELLYLNWKKVLIKTHDGLWDYWEGGTSVVLLVALFATELVALPESLVAKFASSAT